MFKHPKVRSALVNKLACQEVTGGKEIKYRLYIRQRCVATTSLPKEKGKGRQIGPGLLRNIAGQLYITADQLEAIMDCCCDLQGYIAWLKNSPRLANAPSPVKKFLSTL